MAKKPTVDIVETVEKQTETIPKFNKAQLIKSKRYADKRDILTVFLKDGEMYSVDDADRLIDEFMKGKVK